MFKGDYTPRAGGRFHVIVKNESGDQQLETDLNVERSSREKVGEPANLAILRDIAALTGGAVRRHRATSNQSSAKSPSSPNPVPSNSESRYGANGTQRLPCSPCLAPTGLRENWRD